MLLSLRSALLVIAAISGSSVAPAQVSPASEPLLPLSTASLPSVVPAQPLSVEVPAPVDPLAPLNGEQADVEPVKPTGDLASLVAQLRSTEPGSRELECLAVGIYFESKSE